MNMIQTARWRGGLLVLVVVASFVPRAAQAQVTRADTAAVLLRAAEQFEAQERWEVADAVLRLLVERYGDTPAGEAARVRLAATVDRREAGSGRVELQVWATTFGLWLGIAVPAAFGAESTEPYGLGLLLGGPLGFFGGRAYARSRDVTEGQARAITLGGAWGTWQGLGWAQVLDLGEEEVCPLPDSCYRTGNGTEQEFASMVAGGLAGMVAGALIARRPVSAGVATSANFGSLWGSWFGVAAGILLDLEDDDLLVLTLVGGDVGLVAGAVGASRLDMSRSRSRMVSIAGVLGGVAGAGLDLLLQPDNEKVAIGIPLAGSLIGLGVGLASTRQYDTGGAGRREPSDDALLNVRGRRLGLGTPVPFPTLLEAEGPGGSQWRPALGMTILRATF